jgi:hypothetical protein
MNALRAAASSSASFTPWVRPAGTTVRTGLPSINRRMMHCFESYHLRSMGILPSIGNNIWGIRFAPIATATQTSAATPRNDSAQTQTDSTSSNDSTQSQTDPTPSCDCTQWGMDNQSSALMEIEQEESGSQEPNPNYSEVDAINTDLPSVWHMGGGIWYNRGFLEQFCNLTNPNRPLHNPHKN